MAETGGSLIDKLIIVNIKIFMLEDVKRDNGASDKEIADATRKTNVLNSERNSLIDEINILANDLADGKKMKLFGSNKMYGKK